MKKIYNILSLFTVLAIFASCNFLDQYPDSRLKTEIDNLDKIKELLTGAYPKCSYFRFLELRTDNVGNKHNRLEASRLNEAMFYWKNYDENNVDSPFAYWLDCYRGIAQANQALVSLAEYKDKNDPKIKALYGEAFLLRAYYHFMLVNIWAPPYQGSEASKNIPGIPYVDAPEKHALVSYKQLSLQEVYDKIQTDLNYGLSLVDDNNYGILKYHFNKKAAYAFAVRFYSYTAQWEKVIEYSGLPLTSNSGSTLSKFADWKPFKNSEYKMSEYYSSNEQSENLLIATVESQWQDIYISDRYGLDYFTYSYVFLRQGKNSLMQMDGYVKTIMRRDDNTVYYPKFMDFTTNVAALNSERGHYTYNVLFSTSEVLLHRVVAFTMLEKYDQAINDILAFMKAKHFGDGGSNLPQGSDLINIQVSDRDKIVPFYGPLFPKQSSLIFLVSELMRQQYIHEGLRWFDIRRYNLRVSRNIPGEPMYADGVLQPEDKRKVLAFPQNTNIKPFDKK